MDPGPHRLPMEPLDDSLAEAEHMFAKRGCCCFFVPFLSSSSPSSSSPSIWWQRIAPSKPDPWWSRAIVKVREWSEILAGPRWKTFIRRFRRTPRFCSSRFNYDPTSYARNFDEGHHADDDADYASFRGFSARYASLPLSSKSSLDLGGKDAPSLLGWPEEIARVEKMGS